MLLSRGRFAFLGIDMVFSDLTAESAACFAGEIGGVESSIFAASSSAVDAFLFFGRALAFLFCLLMLALIQTDLVVVSALIPLLPFLPHGLFVGVEPKPPLLEDTIDLVL